MGDPVAQSRSPQIHQAAYQALGQDWSYSKRQVKASDLGQVLDELSDSDLLGINLTLPLKQAAFEYTCSNSPEATAVGAINCLRRSPQGWQGHNTDGTGWLDSWQEEIGQSLQGRPALVLGAGGACKAILAVLRQSQVASIALLNRTPERAAALLRDGESLGAWSPEAIQEQMKPGLVVIQTTSVGMWPHAHQTPLAWPDHLPDGVVACDLIYNPRPTLWLEQARQRGAKILDGCGMLVHQAARAIEWWSGIRPPTPPMKRALLESLS